ncbi:hypothetical protein MAR_036375 [Mya arenaria]|uniref:Uncharacterized protein n=1 Tax=Mya arenaria TaxID=6604 RepID=A0ABY7FU21_MYAAR|nr:hypothetical protein MAR_036375 [Mya arenaria]
MKHPDKAHAMLLENLRIISEHRRRSIAIENLRRTRYSGELSRTADVAVIRRRDFREFQVRFTGKIRGISDEVYLNSRRGLREYQMRFKGLSGDVYGFNPYQVRFTEISGDYQVKFRLWLTGNSSEGNSSCGLRKFQVRSTGISSEAHEITDEAQCVDNEPDLVSKATSEHRHRSWRKSNEYERLLMFDDITPRGNNYPLTNL